MKTPYIGTTPYRLYNKKKRGELTSMYFLQKMGGGGQSAYAFYVFFLSLDATKVLKGCCASVLGS